MSSDRPLGSAALSRSRASSPDGPSASVAGAGADPRPSPVADGRPPALKSDLPPSQPATILVADDDRLTRELLSGILVSHGYRVETVGDGQEALERVSRGGIDLALLDIVMPRLSGLEACRLLKAMTQEAFLPVVLVTVKTDSASRVDGLKIGADDYVCKPFEETELLARVEAMLRIKRLHDHVANARRRLEQMSVHDELTGLYNYRYLHNRLTEEFKRAERYHSPLAVVFIDIDHLKAFNDAGDHALGDEVIRMVADIIKRRIRDVDVVARYGGEEYLVALPSTHFAGSVTVANRIWRDVADRTVSLPDGRALKLAISVGVGLYPSRDVRTKDALVRAADSALQQAKRDGGNRICVFQQHGYIYSPGAGAPPTPGPSVKATTPSGRGESGRVSRPPPRPPRLPPSLLPNTPESAGKPVEHPARVMVVDDDAAVRRSVARILMTSGFDVSTAENGAAALTLLQAVPADVVLCDLNMPTMGGLELLAAVKRAQPDIEVIMMTAFGHIDDAVSAVKNGAYDFLTKPFASNDVVAMSVSKAAERKLLLDRMRALEEQLEGHQGFGELIGNTPKMRELYDLARGVAPTSTTVLILGESGTGKELIARAIHQSSGRADRPFIAVNCSAIPIDLVESELFGHMRGAFTGALATRVGLFEAAHHGTLFLDEIGDLPLPAQVKLLRALQEGEVKKVGSNDTATVDVRVVAATNVDLKSRIAAGKFREDLYYRLAVIAIRVPPLRQRRDDIPLLAYHFLRKYAVRMNRPVTRIGVEAMRALREQKWPGNVRELENAIEHAVVMARGETVVPGDLPSQKQDEDDNVGDVTGKVSSGSFAVGSVVGPLSDLPYATAKRRALEAFEQAYLEAVLRRAGGNVSEAARQAGLDRSDFRRVLKKTDVRRE